MSGPGAYPAAVVTELRQALDGTANRVWSMIEEHGAAPLPDSPFAAEAAEAASFGTRWEGSISDTLTHVWSGASAALDHLRSYHALLAPEIVSIFGPSVMERTILESAGRAWWLSEPDLGARVRVERGYMFRVRDLRDSARVLRNIGASDEAVAVQEQRLAHVLTAAADLGLDTHWKGDVPEGLRAGQAPAVGEILDDMLGGFGWPSAGGMWDYLSGIVHARFWALQQFVVISKPSATPATVDVQFGLPLHFVWMSAYSVLLAHVALWDRIVPGVGWPAEDWGPWRAHMLKVAIATAPPREIWRARVPPGRGSADD